MKKFFLILIVTLLFSSCLLVACQEKPAEPTPSERKLTVTASELKEKAFFDLEKHPDLADNGMFWIGYDQESGKLIRVSSDDTATVKSYGTMLYDPSKPTILNVHGIQLDSYFYHLPEYDGSLHGIYDANKQMLDSTAYGYDTPSVNMLKLYLDNGFNVMTFDYYRFADEPIGETIPDGEENQGYGVTTNKTIEAKIWATDGVQKMRYRKRDGTWSHTYDADGNIYFYNAYTDSSGKLNGTDTGAEELPYCLAEYFAGYWLRALDCYDITQSEVRFAGHSMGGSCITATATLLMDLVAEGDVTAKVLPHRLSLEDPFMGVASDVGTMGKSLSNPGLSVHWRGETVCDNVTGKEFYQSVKNLVERHDVAVECYFSDTAVSQFLGNEYFARLNTYMPITKFNITAVSNIWVHNGVRECYLGSVVDNPPITSDSYAQKVLFANSPIEEVKAARGKMFILTNDNKTGKSNDDTYVTGCPVAVVSANGSLGKVFSSHPFDVVAGTSITVTAKPATSSINFDGWYDANDNLVSTDLTYTVTAETKAIVLIAKFSA